MHWRNSDFQIKHFLVGKCHTADEAYRLLKELREERQKALDHASFSGRKLMLRLSYMRWLQYIPVLGEWARIEIEEAEKNRTVSQALIDACVHEINTIDDCLAMIEPHRKFSGLPDPIAYQAAQESEWLEELKWRAENYLLTGSIPMDQLSTMRMHPGFSNVIWPHIQTVRAALRSGAQLPEPKGTALSKLLEDKRC